MKRFLRWFPIAVGIAFLLLLAYFQRGRALRGENDFVAQYAGAKLVGTPDLYSRAKNLVAIKEAIGLTMESVTYIRPPFYAVLLKPLAWLPYRAAYAVFTLASLASILWFVIHFSKECPSLPFFAAMSIPAVAAICGGQDTPFLLAILGASIPLMRRERDFSAGLLLSLLAIKFNLFFFLPILLLIKKKWRILGGAAVGTMCLVAIGTAGAGFDSMREYVAVLRDPWINASADVMPNIHNLAATLHGGVRLEAALTAGVLGVFLWTARRIQNFEFLFAISLVCGLLASFHSEVPDDLVLLPAFVSVIATCLNPLARAAAALILTPIPYFMCMAGAPYSAMLPLALLFLFGILCGVGESTFNTAPVVEQAPCAS